jgi:ribosomal protein S18 acetylase RimI-like enzyme
LTKTVQNRSLRRPGGFEIRPARPEDADAVAACVRAAYNHYVERIGRPPGPMLDDYAEVIRDRSVAVAHIDKAIVGVLVTASTEEGFLLENVAVVPACKGQGIGRALLEMAERAAVHQGFGSIYLYTHEKMTENRALYEKIGYVEYARREEQGLARVYMRKRF